MRLINIGLQRGRLALTLGCCAFAIATLAILVAVVLRATWVHPHSVPAGDSAELVAFLRDDLPAASRDTLTAALGRLPEVARVRLLDSDEVLSRMRKDLGDRASVLDGVEEGFLPATLEITLRPGRQGIDRADAIAWRLRRTEGITDVDLLRTADDDRLARAEATSRRAGQMGMGLALAAAALALCLAAFALRRPPSDARLLSALGFTTAAIAGPGAILGGLSAATGALVGTCMGALVARVGLVAGWSAGFSVGGTPIETRSMVGGLLVVVLLGACLGWWGWRPSGRGMDELESTG